jgi:flagellar hook-associated protein FlgK
VALLGKSQTLCEDFQNMFRNLEQIQKDISASIGGSVEDINLAVDQIADLIRKSLKSK